MKITKEMIKENTVFYCNTKDKNDELLEKLDGLGYKWFDGSSYLSHSNYNSYKESTCYFPYEGVYGAYDGFYKTNNYEIIEYVLDKDVKFTMDDIKDGYLIELRNGDKYLCYNDFYGKKIFISDCNDGFLYANNYRLDLIYRSCYTGDFSKFDIVKVYDRSSISAYLLSLKIDYRELLWEREVEVTEMTMEEVCKIVGKNVKIVK